MVFASDEYVSRETYVVHYTVSQEKNKNLFKKVLNDCTAGKVCNRLLEVCSFYVTLAKRKTQYICGERDKLFKGRLEHFKVEIASLRSQ